MHLIHSVGSKTPILGRSGLFPYCTKVDAKLAEMAPLVHKFAKEVASKFFAMKAPDPVHWIQNLCFEAFRTVCYGTKVNLKLAELVPLTHKFAKQTRICIFRKERTRSTLLDPKLMFWGVSDRFVTGLCTGACLLERG
jgi:hypothetical protein